MIYPDNPHKVKNGIRELGAVDIKPIRNLLLSMKTSLWQSSKNNNLNTDKKSIILNYTSKIKLKITDRSTDPVEIQYSPVWDAWKLTIVPILDEIVKCYAYERYHFPMITFAKLSSNSPIIPHTDGPMSQFAPHKIHVPIQTNDDTFFFIGDNRWHLKEGMAYEVDNITKHAAINAGHKDRIHLIFECMFGEE